MSALPREDVTYRESCRVDSQPLRDLFSLGDLPLSGFCRPGATTPVYPLALAVGVESRLVQLRHTVAPDAMYRNYWYRSSTNETMVRHLHALAEDASERAGLATGDCVLDIGSNDGTLLSSYDKHVWRIGFDPSNVPVLHNSHDIRINDYFNAARYPFPNRKAKIVTTIAMLYDIEDIVGFCEQVRKVMARDGLWVAEQHWIGDMIQTNDYSVICAEHLLYFSLTSLKAVLDRAGLMVEDVSMNATNGGSFRVYIRRKQVGYIESAAVAHLIARERALNLDGFIDRVKANRAATLALLMRLKAEGKTVIGCGASTKFNTVLSYCGITPDLLPVIMDRNPDKAGLVTAGTNIPIVTEDSGRAMQPDYMLVGPYHFLDSIRQRERAFVNRGGRFIVLFPEPHLVE